VKFAFIATEKASFPVGVLCTTLGVSRAGFYAAQKRPLAARVRADQRLGLEIATIHAESRQRYGSPRIQAELEARGHHTSRKRVARLMSQRGLAARRRRRFRVTTDACHPFPIAPNVLARQFAQVAPDVAWVTDITYILTGEGWLYLAVILDLCSRFVVGWALSDRITRQLTLDALAMALARRRPPRGLLHHSDRTRAICEPRVPAGARDPGHRPQHEPARELLGQRGRREFLRHAQGGARARRGLGHPSGGPPSAVRVHRSLLQRRATTFGARTPQPPGLRAVAC
jgi:hypothetical protein